MPPEASKSKAAIRLFSGSDDVAMKKAASAWVDSHMPEDALNYEMVESQVDRGEEAVRKIEQVREGILTLPFLGGGKLIWWKNVNFLEDSPLGRQEDVLAALESLAATLETMDKDAIHLVISASGVDKRRSFPKLLLKMSESTWFDLPDLRKDGVEEAIFRIEERLREGGLRVGSGVADRLLEATGLEPHALAQEIEKLICYHGSDTGPVTEEEAAQVVSGRREVLVWDFCDAVLAGKTRLALDTLQQLLRQEESEVGMLILLSGQVRLAALSAVLMDAGWMKLVQKGPFANAEVTAAGQDLLPRKKNGEPTSAFMLAKAARHAKRKPVKFWVDAIGWLHEANRALIGGTSDKARILEGVVLRLTVA